MNIQELDGGTTLAYIIILLILLLACCSLFMLLAEKIYKRTKIFHCIQFSVISGGALYVDVIIIKKNFFKPTVSWF